MPGSRPSQVRNRRRSGSSSTFQEGRLFSPPPKAPVPSQIHRRLLFAKSRSQAVSKTESLKSSEASPALGLSPADSSKCIITLSSFEVELLKKLSHIILRGSNVFNIFPIKKKLTGAYPSTGALASDDASCQFRSLKARSEEWKWQHARQRRGQRWQHARQRRGE